MEWKEYELSAAAIQHYYVEVKVGVWAEVEFYYSNPGFYRVKLGPSVHLVFTRERVEELLKIYYRNPL